MIVQTVRFAMAVVRSKVESGCTRNLLPNALVDDVTISILRQKCGFDVDDSLKFKHISAVQAS